MTGASNTSRDDRYDQAAEWFIRRQRGDLDSGEQADFTAWLAAPENAAAYDSVKTAWGGVDLTTGDVNADIERMTHEAYAELDAPRRRWPMAAAAACAVFVAAAAGLASWSSFNPPAPGQIAQGGAEDGGNLNLAAASDMYFTEIGERSNITLDDGSQVILNTDSRLRVEMTAGERRIFLQRGQALFEVAKNPDRPFIVTAGGREVVALGTAFDVRMDDPESLQVTLIEGSVSVADVAHQGPRKDPPTRLSPGEQFLAAGAETPKVRPAEIANVTSWRDGKLIFTDKPLSQAVAEVNRYSTRKIVLTGEDMGDLRVSGVFRTGRTDSFVQAVTGYFPLTASDAGTGEILLHANGA